MAVLLGTEDIPLHPATTKLARWRAGIVAAALLWVGPVVALFARQWLWAAVGVAGAGLLAWGIHRYQLAYLARFRCTLLPDGLKVSRGIWWRSESFVPRSRIQHTDVNQGRSPADWGSPRCWCTPLGPTWRASE